MLKCTTRKGCCKSTQKCSYILHYLSICLLWIFWLFISKETSVTLFLLRVCYEFVMNSITIKEVRTKQEINDFVKFVDYLYTDCRYYIPDLESDIRDALNPAKNTGLESSEVQAFIAYNEEGKPVGRIAGIINYCANKKWQTKNVRFGFIDFIDDMEISAALLKAVEQWGKERGMDHICLLYKSPSPRDCS